MDCPYYLSIGMTYEQYWYGDVWMVGAFREADKLRQKRANTDAWLQGKYVYDAVGRLAPILHAFAKKGTKPTPYLKEPYRLGVDEEKTEREKAKQEESDRIKAKLYMQNMVRAGKNWGK